MNFLASDKLLKDYDHRQRSKFLANLLSRLTLQYIIDPPEKKHSTSYQQKNNIIKKSDANPTITASAGTEQILSLKKNEESYCEGEEFDSFLFEILDIQDLTISSKRNEPDGETTGVPEDVQDQDEKVL